MDSLSLQLITWNVAVQFPDQVNLSSLLPDITPDFVLFGLQEVKSQPQNLVADNLLSGEDPWTARLRMDLSSLGYIKVKSIRLMGIVLSLFSLTKHVPHIRGLETQYTRLGFGGYWGNKGVVSVRWKVYGVSVCVVNSHLAAHAQFNKERIESYNNVLGSHTFKNKETEMILYHDYVFWMGDLNFRLEVDPSDLSPEDVAKLVSGEEFGKLLATDQLTTARSNGEAFSELNETLPSFPPSYKFKIGTSDYDLKRAPAWTDRILFKANVANYDHYALSVRQHEYSSHASLCQSDHKPVSSHFSLAVFSQKIATELLLPRFNPIVTFLDTGPCYVNEDLTLIYTVKIEDRRWLSGWDWIALYRADSSNLEDFTTYTWASVMLVRDGVYEVVFGETLMLSAGWVKFVYFSGGGKDILGCSQPISVRSRQFSPPPTELATEAVEGEL